MYHQCTCRICTFNVHYHFHWMYIKFNTPVNIIYIQCKWLWTLNVHMCTCNEMYIIMYLQSTWHICTYVHQMFSTMYIECTFSVQHMTAYCTIWTWFSYIICTMHVNSMYLCCVLILWFDLINALVYASIYAYILNNVVLTFWIT